MVKKQQKSIFVCQSCGHRAPRWMGRCPECDVWDSFMEEREAPAAVRKGSEPKVYPMDSIPLDAEKRTETGIAELDRVLGGGLVSGSLVLIGGDPGIGKSTLMLQTLAGLAEKEREVLYVSGEESIRQIRLRSQRLGAVKPGILVAAETDVERVLHLAEAGKPDVLVIDSIQTMFSPELSSAPGSVSQVREATLRLMLFAKKSGIPTLLVGHVTKDGAIAGPRLLEHMVDTVLYFEGDRNHVFRILRAVKNRFGSTNEIGVFEMQDVGLREVGNPSAVFLAERPEAAAGSVVTTSMEGSRPILVELQALVTGTGGGSPRRTIAGLDSNRVALLAAVLEKKVGLNLAGHDIFMNVAGGVKVDEPAVDMGVVAALASSFLDRAVDGKTVVLGEVGLTGEVRAVSHLETRMGEALKMGFSRCLVPVSSARRLQAPEGMVLEGVKTVEEAMERLF
ncbi:DNA repair protein RadA/Sms [Desulfobotulus alkaliphilus]|uniref:DNA repair protein RadA n=1 Tax=Desulfobotulus alkaliphilus TaxID=622671 RepID=A0A562S248_9BACT|nr:DNA repair protein RadA [Desulfobotulus alkaliphilus]TWI75392.1 DNA repair protein RadA/Sms [Desulfobotulus alkaliphilus]